LGFEVFQVYDADGRMSHGGGGPEDIRFEPPHTTTTLELYRVPFLFVLSLGCGGCLVYLNSLLRFQVCTGRGAVISVVTYFYLVALTALTALHTCHKITLNEV